MLENIFEVLSLNKETTNYFFNDFVFCHVLKIVVAGPTLVILLSVHAGHTPHNFSVPDRE